MGMMDLTCKEIDFSVDEIEKEILDEERQKRYAAETKIYFIMKDFINVLNLKTYPPNLHLRWLPQVIKKLKMSFK